MKKNKNFKKNKNLVVIIVILSFVIALISLYLYLFKINNKNPSIKRITIEDFEKKLWIKDIKVPSKNEKIDNFKYKNVKYLKTINNFWIFTINSKNNTFELPLKPKYIKQLKNYNENTQLLLIFDSNNSLIDIKKIKSFNIKNLWKEDIIDVVSKNYKNSFKLNWFTNANVFNKAGLEIIENLLINSKKESFNNYTDNNTFSIYTIKWKISHSNNTKDKVSILYFILEDWKTFVDFIKVNNLLSKTDEKLFNSYSIETNSILNEEIKSKVYEKYKKLDNWKNIFY